MEWFAIIISLFFAMNIGASGAAASFGVAYGSGAIRKAHFALIFCAIGIVLGAVLGGGEVVKTISSGIIPQKLINIHIVLIIIFSATSSLFVANLMGIPLSTSEVTVGAVVGVGVAYKLLFVKSLLVIMMFWLIVPLTAFLIVFPIAKGLYHLQNKGILKEFRWLSYLLILAGFFEAFSAGMNNVANAVGPLVGANIMSVTNGIWLGGIFVALGALLLGKKVLETNGKKITIYTKWEGIIISTTGATLVIISSIFGLPVPLTQVTSSAIIGIGMAKDGRGVLQKHIVKKILRIWFVSPLFSLSISYLLVKVFLASDAYSVTVLLSVILATLGTISLMKAIKEEKRSIHEEGSGI
ncbi:inorganic phosphate transporter [Peribacillus alkalitolerans]|uniref:inorganic phosphate transporter n=1 Tax=Peribacillus alkalitolerans TaxID=1550385 RepID=UPI0013D00547|nr:inorganic phosphate transporter [Peribacillus alkalitolerans]